MKPLIVKLIVGICLFAVGALSALWATTVISGSDSETRSTQLINSITREEQVVLLSLGIQGIEEKNEPAPKFFGVFDIPGSKRTTFVQYTFNVKLGIEGRDVKIKQVGDGAFLVSIPEFIFIGHYDPDFKLITEKNGVLSWMTPEIDSLEMANNTLKPDAQKKFIDSNEEILKDQAKAFYGGIISSIDPTIDVKFEFHQ